MTEPAGARTPKVTRRMVAAGLRVLRESGLLSVELSADELVVRRILEVALLVRPTEPKVEAPLTDEQIDTLAGDHLECSPGPGLVGHREFARAILSAANAEVSP